jgi:hypothetical protein
MADLRFDVPDEIELDEETLASLKQRIRTAPEGRYYSIEEVRALIPKWISKYASQRPR